MIKLFQAKSDSSRHFYRAIFITLLLPGVCLHSLAQQANTPVETKLRTPLVLPGNGAGPFGFFYSGEAKNRNMYIVRNGKITWSHIDTVGKGEISDAVLMTNGNVLFAHQFGVTLINHDNKVLWHYDAPKGHETHSAQPIGKDRVLFVQNGDTAKLFVMNIRTGKTEKEFALPVKDPKSVHGQMRHARLTRAGTILIAHMDLNKVCEYDVNGKQLWSLDVPGIWSAEELKNGNIMVASNNGFVRELTRIGDIVWEYSAKDSQEYKIKSPQIATRLANGNTLINNWFNLWNGTPDPNNLPIQAVEVTPDKKVVWALRAWQEPLNLGPATIIQVLGEPGGISEKVHFGYIK
jgi:outer membrane protein assembly factor BamB